MAEKNLAASRIVTDAFKSGDASKIDSAVAADFVDHTDRGDMGRDSLKKMIAEIQPTAPHSNKTAAALLLSLRPRNPAA